MKLSLPRFALLGLSLLNPWVLVGLTVIGLTLAGWFTHVIVSLMAKAYLLLIVGALVFPVGIIHGIGSWFGAFR